MVYLALRNGPMTALEALNRFGIMRLASRVDELRRQGHTIITETVKQNGKQYAKYHLKVQHG